MANSLYDIYYAISIALFDYRKKYKISQKTLADKLGVTQAMVSKLESGDYNYTVEQLWKIATKLDLDFRIVFQVKGEEGSSSAVMQESNTDTVVYPDILQLAVGS